MIERLFIKPDGPLPKCGAGWFLDFFADRLDNRPASFDGILALVPTRAAAKNLRGAIFAECVSRGIESYSQLRISTLEDELSARQGGLRESVLTATQTRTLWMDVLARGGLRARYALFPNGAPKRPDFFDVAGELMFLQESLADNLLTISRAAEILSDSPDAERWRDLAELEALFFEKAENMGKIPRVESLERALELSANSNTETLAIVGNPDVSALLKSLAKRFDALGKRVVVAIFGDWQPEMFDACGTPAPETFCGILDAVKNSDIRVYPDVKEQAKAVASLAKAYGDRVYSVLSVACEQKSSAEVFKREMAVAGINAVTLDGSDLSQTAVGNLVKSTALFSNDSSYANFLNLVRNPFVLRAISEKFGRNPDKILTDLDFIQNESACADIDQARGMLSARLAKAQNRDNQDCSGLEYLSDLFDFAEGIAGNGGEDAVKSLQNAVEKLIPGEVGEEAENLAAEILRESLDEIGDAEKLSGVSLLSKEVFKIALEHLKASNIQPAADEKRIPLQDWMEIFWSPNPHVALCDMNETVVPLDASDGIFLNDAIRRRLGMRSRTNRQARDAYMLNTLAKSRGTPGNALSVCVPKADAEGEPLAPSRILLQTSELPKRVRLLFSEPKILKTPSKQSPEWILRAPLKPFSMQFSATKLNAYIDSPWQFYLRYVLCMEPLDPQKSELDAAQFGSLFHKTLLYFSKSDAANSTNPQKIRRALLESFDAISSGAFGAYPRAQVRIQLENLRNRISACAEVQARHRAGGWKIISAEEPFKTEICGADFSGVFDRIDMNENDGRLMVLDYKTFEKNFKGITKSKHLKEKRSGEIEWENLQLPLYCHALRRIKNAKSPIGAFFVAPKDTLSTGIDVWDDIEKYESSALDKTTDIIKSIGEMCFTPVREPKFDAFDGVFGLDFETLKSAVEFSQ